MAKQSFVTLFCLLKLTQSITIFGDDKEVSVCHWRDVSECKAICIFIDDVRSDLFAHNFIEKCINLWLGCLCFDLLVGLAKFFLFKLEVFEHVQSDVFLDIREVPLEANAFRLATLVVFKMQSDEASIRRHLFHLILEVVKDISCDKPTMGKHKMTRVVLKSLKVGFGSCAHIIPGFSTDSLEVR